MNDLRTVDTELQATRERVDQLERALQSRIVIEQAKGILRERFGWTVDEAFAVLRDAARRSRRRIHDVAAEVVGARSTPDAITLALAQSPRWRAATHRRHADAQRERATELESTVRDQQEQLAWKEAERSAVRPHSHTPF